MGVTLVVVGDFSGTAVCLKKPSHLFHSLASHYISFNSWCAKICCCEPAVDDDTLVQIITHPQEGTPEDNR